MEYWLLRDGEKYGPYTQEQLGEFAGNGNISSLDRLWHQGLPDWADPCSLLPSLELSDSVRHATEAAIPAAPLESNLSRRQPKARRKAQQRKSSLLRTGLTWIPLFSALLVGALGFQPFVRAVVGPEFTEELLETGWFDDPEEVRALTVGGASMGMGYLYKEEPSFNVVSWGLGTLVGAVNGLSFGAILAWLASLIGSKNSLRFRLAVFPALGSAIGLILNSVVGDSFLLLLVGFLGWKEGFLLGACFAVAHTLDEFRVGAVGSPLESGV